MKLERRRRSGIVQPSCSASYGTQHKKGSVIPQNCAPDRGGGGWMKVSMAVRGRATVEARVTVKGKGRARGGRCRN